MDSGILLALATVLVIAAGLFVIVSGMHRRRSGLDHAYYQKQWQTIQIYRKNGDSGWRLAVMEADKLLDHALKERGYPGQTMGDRLKSANRSFMNTNAVWQAHKLRNRIAHEQNVRLNGVTVDNALRALRAALKDLGAF